MAILLGFLILTLILVIAIVLYCKYAFTYWRKKNVPQVEEPIIFIGNYLKLVSNKLYVGELFKNFYDTARSRNYKHFGDYLSTTPQYYPVDLEHIKNILQRDFNTFSERGFYYNARDDPLSAHLFAIGGRKWKILRRKLSPAYTVLKLKTVFKGILQCSKQMLDTVEEAREGGKPVEIKNLFECFTIDVIGACAFGVDCNSFKSPDAEFARQGRKIFEFGNFRVCKTIFSFAFPNLARWLGVRVFDDDTTSFFMNMVNDSVRYRESNNVAQEDFLQLLLDLKDEHTEDPEAEHDFTIEELTAQVFIFFAAGFETSSITLTYLLYELTVNPDVQNTLRKEINRVLEVHNGQITYEAVMDMQYLNQVVEEVLRKYPPVTFLTRFPVNDYKMPNTDLVIEKGVQCVISILGIHRDPEYYPNPEKFDPERFSDENKQRRRVFTYLPFGEGPRKCIGLRFGLMQVKVGVVVMLKNFIFSLNENTKVPLQAKEFSFTLTPKNEIFLNAQKAT